MSLSVLKSISNSGVINRFEKWALKEVPLKGDMTKRTTNYARVQKIYPTFAMLFAVGVQTGFIYTSKDMPKERKMPLIFNNAIACALAVVGGLIAHKPVDRLLEKMVARANIVYANKPEIDALTNGLRSAVPYFVSAILFKYIGAVLATPLADKTNKFLVKNGIVDYSEKN